MRAGPKQEITAGPLDLSALPEWGGDRVIAFCDEFLKVPKGKGAREQFQLRDWQKEIVLGLFDDPRPRQGLVSIPRGNGKSTLAAALGLYGLFADEVEGAQVLCVASDERQARIVFNSARRMVQLDSRLEERCHIFQDRLYVPDTDSSLYPLPAEPGALQGFDPSLAIVDELHVVTEAVWEAVSLAAGKRDRSLTLAISTPAADSDSVMFRLVELGRSAIDNTYHIGNANLAPGVEIRGDSGFVVAPGVKTPWGVWKRDKTTALTSQTPTLPPQWAARLNGLNANGNKDPIPDEITPGNRHDTLLQVAGAMRRQGNNADEIYAALSVMNTNRCKPPKPDKDVRALAEDIADRYQLEPDVEVTLPSGETLDGGVAKELTRMRDRGKARQIFDAENRPQVEQAEILTLRELVARPQPPTTYRIDQYQPADSRVMLAAQAKAGKTTLTGNVTRSLVDGDLFLGVHSVNPVNRVGIIDFEMSERQLAAWLKDQAIVNDDRVTVIPMRGKASTFDILDEQTLNEWAKRLTGIKYLILDCLRPVLDALGLKESSEAGRFLTPFDELCNKAGIPDSLIVHHMGHHDERSRGDSRLRDWPDVEWQLVREDKDDPASARYIKAYGRDVEVAESLLLYDPESRHLTLTGGTRKDTKAREAIPDIINLLKNAEKPLSTRRVVEGLSETAHSRESLRQALRLSEADGALTVTKGPRNARLFSLTAPVRGRAPTEPPRSQLSAPVPIGTGALNTHSTSQETDPPSSEVTQEPLPEAY